MRLLSTTCLFSVKTFYGIKLGKNVANLLRKGEDFDELAETYVVFITERDVIGDGRPIYKIERYSSGSGKKFEDDSHILYVNGAYRDKTPIGKLMHDFSCTAPGDMHDELAERVRFFKESKEVRFGFAGGVV